METADDNLLSTVRSVVESMGGQLELVAVFDDVRLSSLGPSASSSRLVCVNENSEAGPTLMIGFATFTPLGDPRRCRVGVTG
jgi:hypothetical protein